MSLPLRPARAEVKTSGQVEKLCSDAQVWYSFVDAG